MTPLRRLRRHPQEGRIQRPGKAGSADALDANTAPTKR